MENLGAKCRGFGKRFERSVQRLFEKGLIDREIATRLGVNIMTVNCRTRKWRKDGRLRATKRSNRALSANGNPVRVTGH
jgi:transposase